MTHLACDKKLTSIQINLPQVTKNPEKLQKELKNNKGQWFGKGNIGLAHNDIRDCTQLTNRYLLPHSPGSSTRREDGPRVCIWDPIRPHFGEREVVGISDGNIWKWWWFPLGSQLWPLHCSISKRLQFAIKHLRRSNQQGVDQFGAECVEKRLTDDSQILMRSERDMRLSHAKEILSISPVVWARCTNVTDKTDRPRNGNINTNRRNCFSATLPV